MPERPSFAWRAEGDRIVVAARTASVLRKAIIPVNQWALSAPAASAVSARLQGLLEEGALAPDGTALVEDREGELALHPSLVAALSSAESDALGLPAPTRLALDLRSEGLVNELEFRVMSRWVRPGGTPALATVAGALMTYDGAPKRIPEPLYSLWAAAQRLAAPLAEQDRFGALADLQARLPEEVAAAVSTNGYLSDVRAHYASGFSISLGRPGPLDFNPVLFGRRDVTRAGEGTVLDEEEDSVLSPAMQRLFAEDRFRRSATARSAYVLRDGEYVFVDPALAPALQVVRTVQDAPEAERRRFIADPRRVLAERLGDQAGAADVDQLFIETEQFSARVAGVDVWRTPVLPWLRQTPGAWLPESFGVRIGEEYVQIAPVQVEPLITALDSALETGAPTASINDITLPATEQAREALEALRPFAVEAAAPSLDPAGKSVAPPGGVAEDSRPFVPAGKLFLLVKENFEEVEYAPFEAPVAVQAQAPVEPPARVVTVLKPHQRSGLSWLARLTGEGAHGALLADDMGLGKTLLAIAFMAWLQDEAAAGRRRRAPTLIVAPTGLLGNWRKEIELHMAEPRLGELTLAFGANLRALREEGEFSERDIVSGRATLASDAWQRAGVVLTTYETMRDYHISFARCRFGLIVFDEIQKLKNPTSQVTRAAKTLNADFLLGMTGTPVENRLQDLWSLMDVLCPGVLGRSRDFDQRFPADDHEALARLRSLLADEQGARAPRMLRRLKDDHLPGLPAKHVHAKAITMPARQASAYEQVVRRAIAGRGVMSEWDGMLQILHALRGISLHPVDPAEAPADLSAYAADSARLLWALQVLDEIARNGEKALIFLENLAMQDRLAGLIQQRYRLPRAPERIHGGVPGPKRHDIVERFQQAPGGFGVMILSPKAGGVGLTLTAANHVIHLSRWWNPAVEDQSTDRVYRIGQDREVHVYLPMAVHPDPAIGPSSFDLRLDALISRKRALSGHMLAPPEGGQGDIAALFDEVSGGRTADAQPSSAPPTTPVGPNSVQTPAREAVAPRPEAAPPLVPQVPREPAPRSSALADRFTVARWRQAPGDRRQLDDNLGKFDGAKIRQVQISDPYAIADSDARRAQARFVSELHRRAATVAAVTIEYAPPRQGTEPDQIQRVDMNRRLLAAVNESNTRVNLVRRERGRSSGGDFHDREVIIDCDPGQGGVSGAHELELSRGLIGLMNERFECVIHYAPPGA